mmetsp:Transcript_39804/g.118513  ORF Transcript_39804/g.118513 Transcript_39804/m.118513 type:complete len:209 (-) Transcript_39804:1152-1778(-)
MYIRLRIHAHSNQGIVPLNAYGTKYVGNLPRICVSAGRSRCARPALHLRELAKCSSSSIHSQLPSLSRGLHHSGHVRWNGGIAQAALRLLDQHHPRHAWRQLLILCVMEWHLHLLHHALDRHQHVLPSAQLDHLHLLVRVLHRPGRHLAVELHHAALLVELQLLLPVLQLFQLAQELLLLHQHARSGHVALRLRDVQLLSHVLLHELH